MTSPIIPRCSCIISGPHGHCWYQREHPADKDGCLHHPPLVLQLLVLQGHLDSHQPVYVDTDKVVVGSTEEDDSEAGDALTENTSKCPPANSDCVEWDDKTNKKISAGQGDHDQVEPLKVINLRYYKS